MRRQAACSIAHLKRQPVNSVCIASSELRLRLGISVHQLRPFECLKLLSDSSRTVMADLLKPTLHDDACYARCLEECRIVHGVSSSGLIAGHAEHESQQRLIGVELQDAVCPTCLQSISPPARPPSTLGSTLRPALLIEAKGGSHEGSSHGSTECGQPGLAGGLHLSQQKVATKRKSIISQRRPVTEEEIEQTWQTARAFARSLQNPSTVEVMVKSNVYDGFSLSVTREFANSFMPKETAEVTLTDKSGRETWRLRWLYNFNAEGSLKCSLSKGWKKFARDNQLELHDICVFEVVERAEFVFRVHVFRVVEDTVETCSTCADPQGMRKSQAQASALNSLGSKQYFTDALMNLGKEVALRCIRATYASPSQSAAPEAVAEVGGSTELLVA